MPSTCRRTATWEGPSKIFAEHDELVARHSGQALSPGRQARHSIEPLPPPAIRRRSHGRVRRSPELEPIQIDKEHRGGPARTAAAVVPRGQVGPGRGAHWQVGQRVSCIACSARRFRTSGGRSTRACAVDQIGGRERRRALELCPTLRHSIAPVHPRGRGRARPAGPRELLRKGKREHRFQSGLERTGHKVREASFRAEIGHRDGSTGPGTPPCTGLLRAPTATPRSGAPVRSMPRHSEGRRRTR